MPRGYSFISQESLISIPTPNPCPSRNDKLGSRELRANEATIRVYVHSLNRKARAVALGVYYTAAMPLWEGGIIHSHININ